METEKEFLQGFEECFRSINDKRQAGKVDYQLIEILFLSVVAIAGGAFSWRMIEKFGKIHLKILRSYYPFKNGAPSDDTIRRVFEIIDPENMNAVLSQYFTQNWIPKDKHIAIDGKSLRGSKRNGIRALHMLNVYASGSGVTLFGKTVEAKTNEITAIPEAIDLLDIKGSIITIDAMGCQRNIAQKIIDKEADYILGLKENQVSLYNEVEKAFSTNAETFFAMEREVTEDKGHGRICKRTCRTITEFSRLPIASLWPGARSIIEIQRETITKGVTTLSTNYYVSSNKDHPKIMMQHIRDHWKIESMHWILDVVFKEDASSMHKGNVPANMAIIRRFVLNILTTMKEKGETRPLLMKAIGWSSDYLCRFIDLLVNRS